MEKLFVALFFFPHLTLSQAATWDYRDVNLVDHIIWQCYLATSVKVLKINYRVAAKSLTQEME